VLNRLALAVLLTCSAWAEQWTGLVVGIQDGDTLTVLRGKEQVKVRLDGIDCPEKAQPFGDRAKQKTAYLSFNRQVTVISSKKDRFGRVLAVILLPNGHPLNDELLRAGLAWWYRKYAPKNLRFVQLEETARDAGLGLWADPHPVPPWLWRKEKNPPTITAP